MKLMDLIDQRAFDAPSTKGQLKTALQLQTKPVVVFDCTEDGIYYSLVGAYAMDHTLIGLTPGDFKALSSADDVRCERGCFFVGGR